MLQLCMVFFRKNDEGYSELHHTILKYAPKLKICINIWRCNKTPIIQHPENFIAGLADLYPNNFQLKKKKRYYTAV